MIGDQEFQSVQLGKWLDEKGIAFILRQKKGTSLLLSGEDKYQPLKALDIPPGTEQFFSGIYYTDSHKLGLFNLATRGQRRYRSKQTEAPWYLLTIADNGLFRTLSIFKLLSEQGFSDGLS